MKSEVRVFTVNKEDLPRMESLLKNMHIKAVEIPYINVGRGSSLPPNISDIESFLVTYRSKDKPISSVHQLVMKRRLVRKHVIRVDDNLKARYAQFGIKLKEVADFETAQDRYISFLKENAHQIAKDVGFGLNSRKKNVYFRALIGQYLFEHAYVVKYGCGIGRYNLLYKNHLGWHLMDLESRKYKIHELGASTGEILDRVNAGCLMATTIRLSEEEYMMQFDGGQVIQWDHAVFSGGKVELGEIVQMLGGFVFQDHMYINGRCYRFDKEKYCGLNSEKNVSNVMNLGFINLLLDRK